MRAACEIPVLSIFSDEDESQRSCIGFLLLFSGKMKYETSTKDVCQSKRAKDEDACNLWKVEEWDTLGWGLGVPSMPDKAHRDDMNESRVMWTNTNTI